MITLQRNIYSCHSGPLTSPLKSFPCPACHQCWFPLHLFSSVNRMHAGLPHVEQAGSEAMLRLGGIMSPGLSEENRIQGAFKGQQQLERRVQAVQWRLRRQAPKRTCFHPILKIMILKIILSNAFQDMYRPIRIKWYFPSLTI